VTSLDGTSGSLFRRFSREWMTRGDGWNSGYQFDGYIRMLPMIPPYSVKSTSLLTSKQNCQMVGEVLRVEIDCPFTWKLLINRIILFQLSSFPIFSKKKLFSKLEFRTSPPTTTPFYTFWIFFTNSKLKPHTYVMSHVLGLNSYLQ